MLHPVVLSGGSGTRLWPLSRQDRPKQFLALMGERSLYQETVLRALGLPDVQPPITVCSDAHRFTVGEQLRDWFPAGAIPAFDARALLESAAAMLARPAPPAVTMPDTLRAMQEATLSLYDELVRRP